MKQLIRLEKELISDAETHLVFVNSDGKPEKIPEDTLLLIPLNPPAMGEASAVCSSSIPFLLCL